MKQEPPLPLDGIVVVAFEHAVAAPLATRQLADLGAEVIKIERKDGDFARNYDSWVLDQSTYFVWLNRGKRSLTLDVKNPESKAILDRLLARADILVQNLAPGAASRLGLGYEDLEERFPRLIVCDISGYGDEGPYAGKKAYDLLIQAESGLVSITGTPETQARCGLSIGDVSTGMYAHAGCLAALVRRGVTGKGGRVQVAMLDALTEWMSNSLYRVGYGGGQPPRMLMGHPVVVPYGAYAVGDGTEVILAVQNDREWKTFCDKVMERPDLVRDPRFATNNDRVAHRAEVKRLIEERFAGLTALEAVAVLDRADIANGRINDIEAVWNHPQIAARNRWREVGTEKGPIRALLPPVVLDGPEAAMGDVPRIGEHSGAILGELGFSAEQVAAFRAAGVV
ncbi:CaiB/BaiF CoA transferase family protein [Azospirillum doebereinerae]